MKMRIDEEALTDLVKIYRDLQIKDALYQIDNVPIKYLPVDELLDVIQRFGRLEDE